MSDSDVPQESTAASVLFAIYLSGLFPAVETAVPDISSLSFMDDAAWITLAHTVGNIVTMLEAMAGKAMQWGAANGIAFDEKKKEAVVLTCWSFLDMWVR